MRMPRVAMSEGSTDHGRDTMHRIHLQELRGLVCAFHEVAGDKLGLDAILGAQTCAQNFYL